MSNAKACICIGISCTFCCSSIRHFPNTTGYSVASQSPLLKTVRNLTRPRCYCSKSGGLSSSDSRGTRELSIDEQYDGVWAYHRPSLKRLEHCTDFVLAGTSRSSQVSFCALSCLPTCTFTHPDSSVSIHQPRSHIIRHRDVVPPAVQSMLEPWREYYWRECVDDALARFLGSREGAKALMIGGGLSSADVAGVISSLLNHRD